MATPKTGNPRGHPKKVKRPVGRPKGEASIMKDYRTRLLNSPKSTKVFEAIFDAALDDNHRNQAAAWKLIVDRIAPLSGFEKEAGGSQRSAITVNITGIGSKAEEPSGGPLIEGDFTEVPE